MIAELTDSTNIAVVSRLLIDSFVHSPNSTQAYAYMPIAWSTGGTVSCSIPQYLRYFDLSSLAL